MKQFAKFFLGFSFLIFSQNLRAQINDVFDYPNLSDNPAWSGDINSFTMIDGRLRSNSETANDTFFIARQTSFDTLTEWRLQLQLQFNTSSTNFVDFVLMSDSANFKKARSLYYIRIGNTSDEVSLYKRENAGSPVKIIDGRDGILNRSNNPLYVKVHRTSSGQWTLWVNDQGLPLPLFEEGSVTDYSLNELPYCGILVRQSTASFFQKHFFSVFYMGKEIRDTIPPILTSMQLVGNDSLYLTFNEDLNSSSVLNSNAFNLIPSAGNFITFLNEDNKSVGLKFDTPFKNLTPYQIQIRGIEDMEGNIMSDSTLFFRFVVPEPATAYDIVIHEIMATPTPVVALPAFRYAELYNRSNKAINLEGFRLSDRTTSSTLGNFILFPDSFVIICPTTAVSALREYGTVLGATSFPSFNKTSDDITLLNPNGEVVHKVFYTDAWYKSDVKKEGGYSLEMIDASNPCAGASNWSGSNDISGGTPGKQNSVVASNPDTNPPAVSQILPLSSSVLQIVFDQTIDSLTAILPSNYSLTINGKNPDSIIRINDVTVQTFWSDNFDTTQLHQIRIQDIEDCSGNRKISRVYKFGFPQQASQNDVIISEIMVRPNPTQGLPAFQFVELKNRSNKIITLQDFVFSDRTGSSTLPAFLLYPDSFVILCSQASADDFRNYGAVISVNTLPSLNQTSDDLYLRSPQNHLIHFVFYTDKWYRDNFKINGGFSLEMIDLNFPCEGEVNWKASVSSVGGTPGKANSVSSSIQNIKAPEVINAYPLSSNQVLLNFTKNIDSLSAMDVNFYEIEEWIENPNQILKASFNQVILSFNSEFEMGEVYQLKIKGVEDCSGAEMEPVNVRIAMPELPERGDILVNEILFNPPPGTTEFVELYNNSHKVLDLRDLRLGNLNEDGSFRDFFEIEPQGFLIFPNQYLCLSTSGKQLCEYYDCKFPENIVKVARFPSYPQQSGGVVVTDFTGKVIDSFLYHENMHYKLLKDKKGVSLERIEFKVPSIVRENWSSATQTAGFATPGYINSIAYQSIVPKGIISLDYDVFSPDGDGYKDRLIIRFELEKAGYLANVYVYNSNGSLVANPIANSFLSAEGSLTWDGFYDNSNDRCPFGIYVILFDAFHPDGSTIKKKLSFTLVGKM